MRNVNIYIWGHQQYNVSYFMDYVNHSGDNDVSLFFLRQKPCEISRQKNVYVFDYPEHITPAWVDVIKAIVFKIAATSVRIHSAIGDSEKINLPLVKAFHQHVATDLQLSLFLYESSFNDLAYRQEFNNLLKKGLRWQEYAKKLRAKLTHASNEWNAIYHYLFNEIVETYYFFDDLYLNTHAAFFSTPHFRYIPKTAGTSDSQTIIKVCSLAGVQMNMIKLIREIVEKKHTLFFIDDGVDFPLGEDDKDACLLQEVAEQRAEFVFLINYSGNIDAKRLPGVNFVRLPEAITPVVLSFSGIVPTLIYGVCSLALFSFGKQAVSKVLFHEHRKFADNVKLSHFLRACHRESIPCIYLNETLNRVEKESGSPHIFSLGESMGDALFAIGSLNAIRDKRVGPFILLAPKIYHALLALCPFVDAVWAHDELDKPMKEAIYIAKVQGQFYTPCSGTHIFAAQHQIDSILKSWGRKNVSNVKKEIVLSLEHTDTRNVDRFIAANNLTDKVVLIHPNEGVPNRSWPKVCWEALTERFLSDGWSVVLIGANTNFYAHKKTLEIGNNRVFNAIDKFTMAETVYLMTKASLLVACDSGPVALAAATDIAICALYSVVPGRYRLPYRHGVLGWNALAVDLSCQHGHCAKYYPSDTRGTFDAWCPNNQTYACIAQYNVDDFYREINQFLASRRCIRNPHDCLESQQ